MSCVALEGCCLYKPSAHGRVHAYHNLDLRLLIWDSKPFNSPDVAALLILKLFMLLVKSDSRYQ